MKKFSVIIPCYNATEYIDRSVGSAVNQSLSHSEYEIIAVNDASTDDTPDKLNAWKEKYPDLIKVINHEENLRQGGARNTAMKVARGEYICFLDADDRLDSNCLLNYKKLIMNFDADLVVTRHLDECDFKTDDVSQSLFDESEAAEVKILEHDRDYSEIVKSDFGYVWCSVYRKDIILNNNIFFPEKLSFEDISWPRIVRLFAKKICVSEIITHYRFDNPVSTMNRKNSSHHLDRLTVSEMLLEEYDRLGVIEREYDTVLNETIEIYYFNSYYMFFTRLDYIPDVYSRIRKTIFRYFPDWMDKYDESKLPPFFQYMIKLLRKAENASPDDLIPFKESLLELLGN